MVDELKKVIISLIERIDSRELLICIYEFIKELIS